MAVTMLTRGVVHTLTQNVGYALPSGGANRVRSSAAVETSQDNSTFTAETLTNNGMETSAAFIRTTAATALVKIERV